MRILSHRISTLYLNWITTSRNITGGILWTCGGGGQTGKTPHISCLQLVTPLLTLVYAPEWRTMSLLRTPPTMQFMGCIVNKGHLFRKISHMCGPLWHLFSQGRKEPLLPWITGFKRPDIRAVVRHRKHYTCLVLSTPLKLAPYTSVCILCIRYSA